jgi:[protein-PII] uridylyltransferase
MPTLLEKIEADAARRLVLPEGRHPKDELARYKDFLRFENHRLKMLHRAGGSGRDVARARAHVLDLLIHHVLESVQKTLSVKPGTVPTLALVAIGGYGRAELNPHSDIDIMFLHNGEFLAVGKANSYMANLTDGLLYTLWDIGLKVGHSVRSIDDCVKVANTNMQSKTSLIEARLVTGDDPLFKRMQATVIAKCVRGFENEYIEARIADQEARRAKFGNSATMQEPNIKNGCGGLRDYQNLLWMAYFKYRARTLRELKERELISAGEEKQLDTAYDYLLRVRNDLHYHVNRPVDVVPKNVQPAIAHNLGYTDRSPRKRLEHFMRDLYTHMRNIFLITRTVEQRLALLPEPKRLPSLRDLFRTGRRRATQQIVDGFKFVDGEIHATTPRVFRDQPRRLMRVFLHAQQRDLKLNPDLAQLIRHQLSLVDRDFLKDAHVHETFKEILNQRGNVAPILRAMHDVGFLGKYLPEFGKLTCLVQHEFYHQYTADEHTLICIEKLDQVWGAQKPPFSNYAQLFQQIERPFILYLALLLHDSGKALEGDHAEIGGQLALQVAKRLDLDGATAHTMCLIIENHLAMSQISQRRDLDDPSVIRQFALRVQTAENLMLLTLHTFADTLGTSDQLWNGFKDSLLWSLFSRTMQSLQGGVDFIRAEEKQRELLADEAREYLPRTISDEEIQAHFNHLPPRYFQIHTARQIASHLTLTHRFMHLQLDEEERALEPIVEWHNEPDRGYSAVTICTWDRAGLFSKIAGSLTASGLNILSAQIFTRTDGIIIDTFFVIDARTGLLAKKEEREKFERILVTTLTGDVNLGALIAKQKAVTPALYKGFEGERMPTVIRFDNETSDYFTVLEIETEDRVGLLYTISQVFTRLDLDISIAKICTEKGAALDSFYLSHDGRKIISPEHQHHISETLRAAINPVEASVH